MASAADTEKKLISLVSEYRRDPLGYTRMAYQWDRGDLKGSKGARSWQADILATIGSHLQNPATRFQPLKIAVASGRGIGKSCLLGMITQWAMSTCVDCRVVITANTNTQLTTKTMPEIGKWFKRSITGHWFQATATMIHAVAKGHERSWLANSETWNTNNTEAFQGLHNLHRRLVLIFDEASGIDDKIWEVSEGSLTDEDTEIIWLAFSNPVKNIGRFRECFGRYRHRWTTRQIDARKVEGTNKEFFNGIVADEGEDSDYTRVHVKGEFPRVGFMQFIRSDHVEEARKREAHSTLSDPLILGVDVARFGDAESVLAIRRGRDARTIPWEHFRGVDTMTLAARVMELDDRHHFDAIFVDGGGVGGGVVDRLRMLKRNVVEVQFGASPDRATATSEGAVVYANKRSEMWGYMRDAMSGLMIPDDVVLADDLTGIMYGYAVKQGRDAILLEKKADMQARGLSSPDRGDALCLVAGTGISTPEGDRNIEDIGIGDWVCTPFGNTRVMKTWESKTDRITTVKFSNGTSLSGKGDHKIFSWGCGQVRLDALTLTNEVVFINQWRVLWRVLSAFTTGDRDLEFRQMVDTISRTRRLTPSAFFTAGCGLIIKARYRRVMSYTTKTVTGVITIFPILKPCLLPTTAVCTCLSSCNSQSSESVLSPPRRMQYSKLLNGIDPKRGNNGTGSMRAAYGRKPRQKQSSVKLVAMITKRIWGIPDIALLPADRESDTTGSLRIGGSAKSAEKNLWLTDTVSKGAVPTNAQTGKGVVKLKSSVLKGIAFFAERVFSRPLKGPIKSSAVVDVRSEAVSEKTVYNLTLEKHNAYYANGVLVFNCLTYAYPVVPSDHAYQFGPKSGGSQHQVEYDCFSRDRVTGGDNAGSGSSYPPPRRMV